MQGFLLPGWCFMLLLWCFTVAGTVCIVTIRCFMCPHGVLCWPEMVFFVAAPQREHTREVTQQAGVLRCRTCWLYQQECRAIEFHGCRGKRLAELKGCRGCAPLNRTFWSGRSLLSLPAARLPAGHAFASDASSHTTSRRGQSPRLRGGVENPSEANAWRGGSRAAGKLRGSCLTKMFGQAPAPSRTPHAR